MVYWLLIISILLVTDVSVCEEKGFLLLILTLLLLCFNRLVRYWARSLLLVFGIMLVNLLSFNAFSIDGCFRPTMVVLRFYSLVKVVSVSKKLYLFRLSLKNTLEFRVFGVFLRLN